MTLNELLDKFSSDSKELHEVKIPGVSKLIKHFKELKSALETKREEEAEEYWRRVDRVGTLEDASVSRTAADWAYVAGYINEKEHEKYIEKIIKHYEKEIKKAKKRLKEAKKDMVPTFRENIRKGLMQVPGKGKIPGQLGTPERERYEKRPPGLPSGWTEKEKRDYYGEYPDEAED